MDQTLKRIMQPRSIAIVGVSASPEKRGYQILRALGRAGYAGRIHLVNPRGGEILGRRTLESVGELPMDVDLAVLCTPAAAAPGLIRDLGERRVGGAIVLAVGFAESGEAGRALERDLEAAGSGAGVRIVGPNTSGLLVPHLGLNLIGVQGIRAGSVALLVQSGNMALALMTEMTERSWGGISACVGVGNQVDVGLADALEYLGSDPRTGAIIVYLEGLGGARRFLAAASRVAPETPIVAIKSGRTAEGARAALSHTGAVAGPYERFSAALRQAGVVEVGRTDELLHVAETLGSQPVCPPDAGIVILSDGGGQGALAADSIIEAGGRLSDLSHETRAFLRELLGPAAAVGNPVDLAGAADGDPRIFAEALEVLYADPSVGSTLVVGLFGGYGIRFAESLTAAETEAGVRMAEAARRANAGLVVHSMYAAHRSAPLEALGIRGVPVVASLDVACRCVVALERRGRSLAEAVRTSTFVMAERKTRPLRHASIEVARAEGRRTLTEPEARSLLAESGLIPPESSVARSAAEAADLWARFGGPVAMKLISARFTHKSDVGGVVLGVTDPTAAAGAFQRIEVAARRAGQVADVDVGPVAVLLTPMLPPPRAELLLGAYRDPQLGPVLTVGAGGIWVESDRDVAHRLLPLTDDEVEGQIAELRVAGRLAGGRGLRPVERRPLVHAIQSVGSVLQRCPDVTEVEVNPLFVYEHEVACVDARIVLAVDAQGRNGVPEA